MFPINSNENQKCNPPAAIACVCVCVWVGGCIISKYYSHYNLNTLGQFIPDNVSSHTVLPSPVDNISNTPVTNIRGRTSFNRIFLTFYEF